MEECKSFNASDFMVKAASLMAGNTTEISISSPPPQSLYSRTSLAIEGGNLRGFFMSGTCCSVVIWGGDVTLCLLC